MITDVPGVLVGHHTDAERVTGCTVVLLPPGSVGACAIVGAAPGTRETDVLDPSNLVDEVHAFVLTGGSAFGLGCADGVMAVLAERGIGYAFGGGVVPIVPTAVIFDLGIGDPEAFPGPPEGRAAAHVAGTEVGEGSVGAGTGATVAKWAGPDHRRKGGIGTASAAVGDTGAIIGALVVCNAVGDVLDDRGVVLAGARPDAKPVWETLTGTSTVLAVVATNARLNKSSARQVARMAAVGISRSVRPAHTPYDGDVVFVAATGTVDAAEASVGAVGAEVVAEALRRGVRAATTLGGVPASSG